MLKLFGAAAVFCALSWCGLHRAGWYGRRLDCLYSWHTAVLEGERMLCDLNEPTPAYLERLRELPCLGAMAEICLCLLHKEERLELAWQEAVRQGDFPLSGDELRVIFALGAVLGRYDAGEQRQSLQYARQQIELQISAVQQDRARLSRVWSVLGISAGLLAVILLY